jgi:hypothetical protein
MQGEYRRKKKGTVEREFDANGLTLSCTIATCDSGAALRQKLRWNGHVNSDALPRLPSDERGNCCEIAGYFT